MSLISGEIITKVITTRRFDTGNETNADSLPAGQFFINGILNSATVAIANVSIGKYTATVTLPVLNPFDICELAIIASVNGVTDQIFLLLGSNDLSGVITATAANQAEMLDYLAQIAAKTSLIGAQK